MTNEQLLAMAERFTTDEDNGDRLFWFTEKAIVGFAAALASQGAEPVAKPEPAYVRWADKWDCQHVQSLASAAKMLREYYDEWPGGLEEIESALKTAAAPVASDTAAKLRAATPSFATRDALVVNMMRFGSLTKHQARAIVAFAFDGTTPELSALFPPPAAIDMVLHCPACGMQHIDAPDERTADWKNELHRSHLCHGCDHIWRPADVATNGVAAVKTTGKADSPIATPPAATQVPSNLQTAVLDIAAKHVAMQKEYEATLRTPAAPEADPYDLGRLHEAGSDSTDAARDVLGYLAYQTDDDKPKFFPSMAVLEAGTARWHPPVGRIVAVAAISGSGKGQA